MSQTYYGVVAEFATPHDAATAANQATEKGFSKLEAYGPFPDEELAAAIRFKETKMAPTVLCGGLLGGALCYAFVYYATVIDYPHNIGGRPINSWPAFLPPTFELTVLGATLAGIVGLLIYNRLPQLYHPIFKTPNFERATIDHFFLCILTDNDREIVDKASELLRACEPLSVSVIEESQDE